MFVPKLEGLIQTGSEEFGVVDVNHTGDLVLVSAVGLELFLEHHEVRLSLTVIHFVTSL